MNEKTILEIYQEWQVVISEIENDWVTLVNHRQLINKRDELIRAVAHHRKLIKDAWLEQKNQEEEQIKRLMDEGAKKTPAKEEVQNDNREARYTIEKLEIDVDMYADLVKNRAYTLRINELDLNKAGVGLDVY